MTDERLTDDPHDLEAADIEAERKFWQEWQGDTECFGTIAKLVLLVVILIHSISA